MRRKKYKITRDEIPIRVLQSIIHLLPDNIDINSIEITALEYHEYTPNECIYKEFIARLKRYVAINGNKKVSRKQLSIIGKISAPTIDKMSGTLLLLPKIGINANYGDYFNKDAKRIKYDLQYIIDAEKYYANFEK